jgi:hypothetical protein
MAETRRVRIDRLVVVGANRGQQASVTAAAVQRAVAATVANADPAAPGLEAAIGRAIEAELRKGGSR